MLDQVQDQYTASLLLLQDNATSTTCCNTSSNGDFEEQTRSLVERVIWSVFLVMIIMASLVGNLLVIVCVRLHYRLREEHANLFIVNLAVTDMSSAAVVMVSSLHALASDKWQMGQVWCDIVCGVNYMLIVVSMLTLCFISLDRYIAIIHALHYHARVTRKRIYLLLGYAWCQGLCFGIVPILARWIKYDYWEVVCAIVWKMDQEHLFTFVIVGFSVCFVLPSAVLILSYCKVMNIALSQNIVHPQHSEAQPTISDQENVCNRNAIKMSTNQNTIHKRRRNFSFKDKESVTLNVNTANSCLVLSSFETGDSPVNVIRHTNDNYITEQNCSTTSQFTRQQTADKMPSSGETLGGAGHQATNSRWSTVNTRFILQKSAEQRNHNSLIETVDVHKGTATNRSRIDTAALINTEIEMLNFHDDSGENSEESTFYSMDTPSSGIYNETILRKESNPTSEERRTRCCNNYTASNSNGVPVSNSGNLSSTPLTDVTTIESLHNMYSNREDPMDTRRVTQPKNNIIKSSSKRNYANSNKAVKSLLIIVTVYFICMAPFCITKLCKVVFREDNLPGYVNLLASIFQYCSSAINPLIYGIFRKDFQTAFMLLAKKILVKLRITANNSPGDFQSVSY